MPEVSDMHTQRVDMCYSSCYCYCYRRKTVSIGLMTDLDMCCGSYGTEWGSSLPWHEAGLEEQAR